MRCGSHRRPLVAAAAATLAFACASAAFGQRIGEDPWQFPDPGSLANAEKQYSRYWYENYAAAVNANPGEAGAREAIDRLRLAVAIKPTASLREYQPRERINIEYFPYFYMARAFASLGEFGPAERCLDKVSASEIGRSSLASDYDRLKGEIETRIARQRLQESLGAINALVARVEGWTRPDGGVDLSDAGRRRAAAVVETASGLGSLPPAEGQQATDNLLREIVDLSSSEIAAGRSRLAELAKAPWAGAFEGKRNLIDASACTAPSVEPDPAGVESAQAALERCAGRVAEALRAAGAWACARLETERGKLERLRDQQRTWGAAGGDVGAPPSIPELPDACGTAWARVSPAGARQAVDALDLAGRLRTYGQESERVTAALDSVRSGYRTVLQAAASRVPRLGRDCVNDLQLAAPARQFDRLRRDPDELLAAGPPKEDLSNLGAEVDGALANLDSALHEGVQRMLAERDQCQGLDTTNLDALPGALSAWTSGRGQSQLDALCSAARRADADVRSCWQNNTAMVRDKVTDYRWLLAAAEEGGDGEPACLAEARGALVPDPPRSDVAGWVRRSREGLGEARSCLQVVHESRKERVAEVRDHLGRIGKTLGAAEGVESIAPMAAGVTDLERKLDAVAGLWKDEAAKPTPEALREALGDAGASSKIPREWWDRLERLRGDDERYAHAATVLGDRAAAELVGEATRRLDGWDRVAASLGPFSVLAAAYHSFGGGDLDAAIRDLRAGIARGGFPDAGPAAALGHASLSYFLFVKSRAAAVAGGGDEAAAAAAEMLRSDAEREARRARNADGAFDLPATLFASRSYREFFEDCCGEATP